MAKTLMKLAIEGMYLNIIKSIQSKVSINKTVFWGQVGGYTSVITAT
jgi:hypothetical protein